MTSTLEITKPANITALIAMIAIKAQILNPFMIPPRILD
jgi:hypothetical protein